MRSTGRMDLRRRSFRARNLNRIMYEDTKAFLHEKGYERYEISNYAEARL